MQINKQLFLALAHTHTHIITQAARERTTAHPLHTIMHRAIDQDPYPLPTRSTRTSRNGLMANVLGLHRQWYVQYMYVWGACITLCVCVCVCVYDLGSSSDSLAGLSFLLESGS